MKEHNEKIQAIEKQLNSWADRIRKAGMPGQTPMSEEIRKQEAARQQREEIARRAAEEARKAEEARRVPTVPVQPATIQPAQKPARKVTVTTGDRVPEKRNQGGKNKGWRNSRTSWKTVTYEKKEFRETCIRFSDDRNLSRFVWRTAELNGMKEVTLSDVQKMLEAADETIWILEGTHEFLAENPDRRAPTWIMSIDRKRQYAAMMKIKDAGWATTELRDITIQGEQRQQRVWTLKKEAVRG